MNIVNGEESCFLDEYNTTKTPVAATCTEHAGTLYECRCGRTYTSYDYSSEDNKPLGHEYDPEKDEYVYMGLNHHRKSYCIRCDYVTEPYGESHYNYDNTGFCICGYDV